MWSDLSACLKNLRFSASGFYIEVLSTIQGILLGLIKSLLETLEGIRSAWPIVENILNNFVVSWSPSRFSECCWPEARLKSSSWRSQAKCWRGDSFILLASLWLLLVTLLLALLLHRVTASSQASTLQHPPTLAWIHLIKLQSLCLLLQQGSSD